VKKVAGTIKKIWSNKQDFSFLLVVLVVYIFFAIPLVDDRFFGKLLFMIFYFIFLSSGISFLDQKKRKGIFWIFLVLPFLVLFSEFFIKSAWLKAGIDVLITLYCIWLGAVVLKRTFSMGHVTVNRVQGAVVVYLLLGLVFAFMYHGIYLLNGIYSFNGLTTRQRTEFVYFSLTTLTTMGYGDITPVNVFARSLSNLEALIGQLYPAVLIARLVSMEFVKSKDQ
jgi:hypothetical protein